MVKKMIIFILSEYLIFSPFMLSVPLNDVIAQNSPGKYPQIHPKVGDELDMPELNKYGLFPGKADIIAVRFVISEDGVASLEIISDQDGITRTDRVKVSGSLLNKMFDYIENFDGMTSEEKEKFFDSDEKIWLGLKTGLLNQKPARVSEDPEKIKIIYETEARARELAKEEWTDERWELESSRDEGGSYRNGGGFLGLTVGATLGMLVGYSLQKREVTRTTTYETGGWDGTETVKYYSYENKHAPHIGTLVGGLSGTIIGSYMGKMKDKEFYLKVPPDIREQRIRARRWPNYLLGFGVIGTGMGFASGKFLYTPASLKSDESSFSPVLFVIGYGAGAVLGTAFLNAFSDRDARERYWRTSILENPFNRPVTLHILPIGMHSRYSYSTSLPPEMRFTGHQWPLIQIKF